VHPAVAGFDEPDAAMAWADDEHAEIQIVLVVFVGETVALCAFPGRLVSVTVRALGVCVGGLDGEAGEGALGD
jgi:hypothetical protein